MSGTQVAEMTPVIVSSVTWRPWGAPTKDPLGRLNWLAMAARNPENSHGLLTIEKSCPLAVGRGRPTALHLGEAAPNRWIGFVIGLSRCSVFARQFWVYPRQLEDMLVGV
jgi:hypothetical protein